MRDKRRKQNEYFELQERKAAEEHAGIMGSLQRRAGERKQELEGLRKRKRDVELEHGTLRARLSFSAKEQGEWETHHKLQLQTQVEEELIEIKRLRRLFPEFAAAAAAAPPRQALLE